VNSAANLEMGIGLMARAPQAGRVKTRLGADIGIDKATAIYRDLLHHVSTEIIKDTKEQCGAGVSFYWFVDPEESIPALSKQYGGFAGFLAQCEGDLGERMEHALETLLQRYEYAALIGADIPDISAGHISEALAALQRNDVVLGPTFDGGYYLIGVRAAHKELFSGIPWSAPNTLEKTISACESANLDYFLLETLGDLDSLDDFARIRWRPKSVSV
jgi:uncharacterized protein